MATPIPPPAGSFSSLFAEAEGLSRNTGIIVMLFVGLELVLYLFTLCYTFPADGSDFNLGSVLTAVLPLQTALVGYANKDAVDQQQALMAISAVSILSLSHQSNWLVNAFSWKGFAQVVVSSASILVSAFAVIFNTGFHGHYRRVPVYAFVIVICVVEGMSALCVASDLWDLQSSRHLEPSHDLKEEDSEKKFPAGLSDRFENLIKELQEIVGSENESKDSANIILKESESNLQLASLLDRNRDHFRVEGGLRSAHPFIAIISSLVLLSLMAVAAADTNGFEQIVLSFCSVAVFLRGFGTLAILWLPNDKLPGLCQGPYGIGSTGSDPDRLAVLQYFCKSLAATAGQATDPLPVLLRAWYELHRNGDITSEALSLAPEALKVEFMATGMSSKSLSKLAEDAEAKGFGSGRKVRWSKFELNLFLVWYASLLELIRFEREGKPNEGPCKGEEGV